MSLKESSYLLDFRVSFQIYQIHNAFHKDLRLRELEIVVTLNNTILKQTKSIHI